MHEKVIQDNTNITWMREELEKGAKNLKSYKDKNPNTK